MCLSVAPSVVLNTLNPNMPSNSRGQNGKYRKVPTYEDDYDNDDNDDFIMDAVRSQQQMMKDQDEVSLSVGSIQEGGFEGFVGVANALLIPSFALVPSL